MKPLVRPLDEVLREAKREMAANRSITCYHFVDGKELRYIPGPYDRIHGMFDSMRVQMDKLKVAIQDAAFGFEKFGDNVRKVLEPWA